MFTEDYPAHPLFLYERGAGCCYASSTIYLLLTSPNKDETAVHEHGIAQFHFPPEPKLAASHYDVYRACIVNSKILLHCCMKLEALKFLKFLKRTLLLAGN